MIVAVDGPAAAGKGTLARALAAHYGLAYLDTGAIYRGVAKAALQDGVDPEDAGAAAQVAARYDPGRFPDADLRTPRVAAAASVVAKHPGVRAAVLAFQRDFAARPPGAVLDGRDIGTVVLPDADVKLFVTASVAARTERRFLELAAKDSSVSRAAVRADLEARDARDRERAVAPMKPAADAILIDTSDMTIDQAFAVASAHVDAARRSRPSSTQA